VGLQHGRKLQDAESWGQPVNARLPRAPGYKHPARTPKDVKVIVAPPVGAPSCSLQSIRDKVFAFRALEVGFDPAFVENPFDLHPSRPLVDLAI